MYMHYTCIQHVYIRARAHKHAHQVLIPSLMPAVGRYPQTGDNLRDIRDFADDFYVTVLRRFWLADFTHKGFWPRLICRVANDQQIVQVHTHSFVYSSLLYCYTLMHVHIM